MSITRHDPTTDLALPDDPMPVRPVDPTGGRLVAWAESLHAAMKIGQALCGTAFVPAQFRGRPEEAAAAVLFGDEIGLSPTQALQSVHVISGKPGLSARAMVALVLSAGHQVWAESKSDHAVVVCGQRAGSSHVIREEWTAARAQKAGYTSNRKYATDPQAMLYARAASDVCRQVAPDVLAGLAHSAEELELADGTETTTVTRSAAGSRRVARRRAPARETSEPPLDEGPGPSGGGEPDPVVGEVVDATDAGSKSYTPAQMRMAQALWARAGITEPADKRRYAARVAGREIASATDLTREEMTRVIDELNGADEAEEADLDAQLAEEAAR